VRLILIIGFVIVTILSSLPAASTPATNQSTTVRQQNGPMVYSVTANKLKADNGQVPQIHILHAFLKAPKQGPQHPSALPTTATLIISTNHHNDPFSYFTPSYLPLKRLLLFPNHYFW
jgi:hypothetical protein